MTPRWPSLRWHVPPFATCAARRTSMGRVEHIHPPRGCPRQRSPRASAGEGWSGADKKNRRGARRFYLGYVETSVGSTPRVSRACVRAIPPGCRGIDPLAPDRGSDQSRQSTQIRPGGRPCGPVADAWDAGAPPRPPPPAPGRELLQTVPVGGALVRGFGTVGRLVIRGAEPTPGGISERPGRGRPGPVDARGPERPVHVDDAVAGLGPGARRARDDWPRARPPPRSTQAARAKIVSLAGQKPKDLGWAPECWPASLLAPSVREHAAPANRAGVRGVAASVGHDVGGPREDPGGVSQPFRPHVEGDPRLQGHHTESPGVRVHRALCLLAESDRKVLGQTGQAVLAGDLRGRGGGTANPPPAIPRRGEQALSLSWRSTGGIGGPHPDRYGRQVRRPPPGTRQQELGQEAQHHHGHEAEAPRPAAIQRVKAPVGRQAEVGNLRGEVSQPLKNEPVAARPVVRGLGRPAVLYGHSIDPPVSAPPGHARRNGRVNMPCNLFQVPVVAGSEDPAIPGCIMDATNGRGQHRGGEVGRHPVTVSGEDFAHQVAGKPSVAFHTLCTRTRAPSSAINRRCSPSFDTTDTTPGRADATVRSVHRPSAPRTRVHNVSPVAGIRR